MEKISKLPQDTSFVSVERVELMAEEFMDVVDDVGFVHFDDRGSMNRSDRTTLADQLFENYDIIQNHANIDAETKEEVARRMGMARSELIRWAYKHKLDD